MPVVYTARVSNAHTSAASSCVSASAACSADREPTLPLQEYVLRISPQALVHAHLFYIKAARVLAARGLLVYPTPQSVIVLVTDGFNNAKGVKTVLSWLAPLLPTPPAYMKRASATKRGGGSSSSGWSLLFKPVDHSASDDDEGEGQQQLGPRERIELEGVDEAWKAEVQLAQAGAGKRRLEVGVSDSIIQACLTHAVTLELNRQGWAQVAGRFVRIPAGCTPSPSVPAVALTLTLTQQQQLSIFIYVEHVKFNALHANPAATDDLRFSEMMVKVLPELTDALIMHTTGRVGGSTNDKSLGVDREMWLEKHGVQLPHSFPVVKVQVGKDEAFGSTLTETYPLCCCLTSGLLPTHSRLRDEAALAKLSQEQASIVDELMLVLKSLRLITPSSAPPGGQMQPFLTHFEQQECGALLQALNPSSAGKSGVADVTISSDIGFQKASGLAGTSADGGASSGAATAAGRGTKRRFKPLTIPASKKTAATASEHLSLAFVKSQTVVPAPSMSMSSFDNPFFGSSITSAAPTKEEEKRGLSGDREEEAGKPPPAKRAKTTSAVTTATSAKPASSMAAAKATSSINAASSSNKGSKAAKETEGHRAARKEREKNEKAAAKSAAKLAAKMAAASSSSSSSKKTKKLKSSSSASAGWEADFAAAFQEQLANPTATAAVPSSVAEFQRALGSAAAGPARASASAVPSATAAPKAANGSKKKAAVQTKLSFSTA